MSRRFGLLLWGIASLGLAIRLGVAARTLDVVDQMFVPDDTYYTLNIARSLAHGLGPTADGIHLTNGFQPLIAFLLAPVYWMTTDPDAPLRSAWVLLSACDAVTAVALGALARRSARFHGDLAALVATGCWSLSPLALSYAMGGLETSLALMVSALFALAWVRAAESGERQPWVTAGILAGLALLARIDLAFLVLALGAWELMFGNRWGVGRAIVAAIAVVAPWWSYELLRFRTVVPTSGDAVRQQAGIHQSIWMSVRDQVGWALGTVLEAPTGRWWDLRERLGTLGSRNETYRGSVLLVVVIVAMGAFLFRRRLTVAPVVILVAFGVWICGFYALYVPAVWFFPRYMAPTHVSLTLMLSLGVSALWGRRVVQRVATIVVGAAVVLVPAIKTMEMTWLVPRGGSMDAALHGAKGYRGPARTILAVVPRGAILGAMQSGALGYYSRAMPVTVVNLDGVVDRDAAKAFRDARLGAFSEQRGITHFADWAFNVRVLRDRWGTRDLLLTPVTTATPQGSDQFTLYRIASPVEPEL